MARDQQRDQLVAQLRVAHRATVLVPGLDEQREHVVAFLEVVGTAGGGAISSISISSTGASARRNRRRRLDPLGAEHGHA